MSISKGTAFQFNYSTNPLGAVTASAIGSHGWTLNENAQSSEMNSSREDNTVTIRKDGGTEVSLGGKRSDEFAFTIAYDPTDPCYQALKAAYDSDGEIALADADGDITVAGTTVDAGNFNIKEFRRTSGESGATTVNVRAKPTAIFALGVVMT